MTAFQYHNLPNVLPKCIIFTERFCAQNVLRIPATTFKDNFAADARDFNFCTNARKKNSNCNKVV